MDRVLGETICKLCTRFGEVRVAQDVYECFCKDNHAEFGNPLGCSKYRRRNETKNRKTNLSPGR